MHNPPLVRFSSSLQWLKCLAGLSSLCLISHLPSRPAPKRCDDPGITTCCSSLQRLRLQDCVMPFQAVMQIVASVPAALETVEVEDVGLLSAQKYLQWDPDLEMDEPDLDFSALNNG